MSRNSNGGIVAIIITIVVVGGLIYVGLANKGTPAASSSLTSPGSATDHHGGTTGPTTDLSQLLNRQAPNFELTDHNGQAYSLASLRGKKVVLFFNEGMMCYPACWNQIAALGNDDRFKGGDAVALSVVVDTSKEWQQAMDEMPELRAATVVHDVGGPVSAKFGVLKTASSMHYGQLPGHTYVVIDADGVIRHVYDDPNMAIHNDVLVKELAKI
ncbi:MAG: redoxin domain-containing protein [Candidatus Kerfeldbacteria bacterium]|nr:redoxin domain-containing protein [Candidatus Kerfeldbacteria bacterium]